MLYKFNWSLHKNTNPHHIGKLTKKCEFTNILYILQVLVLEWFLDA